MCCQLVSGVIVKARVEDSHPEGMCCCAPSAPSHYGHEAFGRGLGKPAILRHRRMVGISWSTLSPTSQSLCPGFCRCLWQDGRFDRLIQLFVVLVPIRAGSLVQARPAPFRPSSMERQGWKPGRYVRGTISREGWRRGLACGGLFRH